MLYVTRLISLLVLAAMCGAASAQTYPSKPIRLIVPYPPGGGADIVARLVGQKLSEDLKQPVIVDNKPGGSEVIGTDAIAKATPDGYTIGLVTNALAINTAMVPKLPFNPSTDFVPVAYLVNVPMVLVAHPSVPAANIKELVQLARKEPGTLKYASLGSQGPHGLAMEYLKKIADVKIDEIPYKGVAQAMTAASTNEIQVMFSGLTAGLAQVKGGKLKAIGVSTAKRVKAAPEIPSIAEGGYPDFDVTTWYGLVAPKGTPPAVVATLNTAIQRALKAPDLQERLLATGVEPVPMSPAQFADIMKRDQELWAKIVRVTGAKPQ